MGRVTADQTQVFADADLGANVIGPLDRGAHLVVTGEQADSTGHEWTRTVLGFVPSQDVAEDITPWVADVTVSNAPVYAKPNNQDAIRLNVQQGDLLRVIGVSHGMQGDPNIYWSTTEGYVSLDVLQASQNPWATQWTVPDSLLAIDGWWGATTSEANVRAGPSTDAPTVGHLPGGNLVKVLVEGPGQDVQGSATWDRIDGGRYAGGWVHSSLIKRASQPQANTSEPPSGSDTGRWIVVDRALHSLTLVDHGQPAFVTYVALGVAGRDTPAGTYSTWGKYRADDMTSSSVADPGGYYDLPNVPDTMYYKDGGYAIHGTYWHDAFGTDQSHGCVNVTWTDGEYLFRETLPSVLDTELTAPSVQAVTALVII
jgi:lipoprotein-anchoring transpeptidase ErfK/SrfK